MKRSFAAVAALVLGYVAPVIAADAPVVVIRAEVNEQGQEINYTLIPMDSETAAVNDEAGAQDLGALVDQTADSATDSIRRNGGWGRYYGAGYRPYWYGHSYYPYYRYNRYPYNYYYYYPSYYWRRW